MGGDKRKLEVIDLDEEPPNKRAKTERGNISRSNTVELEQDSGIPGSFEIPPEGSFSEAFDSNFRSASFNSYEYSGSDGEDSNGTACNIHY